MADRQQNLYGLMSGANASPTGRSHQKMSGANAIPTGRSHPKMKENPGRIYVIAQAGLSDGGNKERALALTRAAKWTGADAVKFQAFKSDHLTSTRPAVLHHDKGQSNGQEPYKLELTPETFCAVHKEAQRLGIDLVSTPFDEESSDFLDKLGVNAFRISSRDISRRPFIEHAARKGKPMLVSIEMNTLEEVEQAIAWMHSQSNDQIALLHCVASRPLNIEGWSLKSVQCLRDRFGLPAGFADHSAVTLGSIVAASLGAVVIERQFAIESRADTSNPTVAMDAKQLKLHIEELQTISTMLGKHSPFGSETQTGKIASRHAPTARGAILTKRRLAAQASAHKK